LGIAYYATKDTVAAKKMFEHALEIDNTYKPALDNMQNMLAAE
jgi:Tfp pilus assembly protein PilF